MTSEKSPATIIIFSRILAVFLMKQVCWIKFSIETVLNHQLCSSDDGYVTRLIGPLAFLLGSEI